MEQLAGVDEYNGKGSAGPHLAHQGEGHPDPEVGLGDKTRGEAREAGQDLADGEDGSPASDIDGEEDDEVGQDLHPGHKTRPLEQVLLARVEAQSVEAHRDHWKQN